MSIQRVIDVTEEVLPVYTGVMVQKKYTRDERDKEKERRC
jgi:hypothetical protein